MVGFPEEEMAHSPGSGPSPLQPLPITRELPLCPLYLLFSIPCPGQQGALETKRQPAEGLRLPGQPCVLTQAREESQGSSCPRSLAGVLGRVLGAGGEEGPG